MKKFLFLLLALCAITPVASAQMSTYHRLVNYHPNGGDSDVDDQESHVMLATVDFYVPDLINDQLDAHLSVFGFPNTPGTAFRPSVPFGVQELGIPYWTWSNVAYKEDLDSLTSAQIEAALGFLPIETEGDGSPTNELQTLNYSSVTDSIGISGGNKVKLPYLKAEVDGSVTNEIELPSYSGLTNKVLTVNGSGNLVWADITTIYAGPAVQSLPTRSLNSNFTVSSTRPSFVTYEVTLACTVAALSGTATASAFLEYSINAGSSWVTLPQNSNSQALGLTVTFSSTGTQKGAVSGIIPANALVRVRSATAGTGTATVTIGANQAEAIY